MNENAKHVLSILIAVLFSTGLMFVIFEPKVGLQGEQGVVGERGTQGEKGDQGIQGDPGVDGESYGISYKWDVVFTEVFVDTKFHGNESSEIEFNLDSDIGRVQWWGHSEHENGQLAVTLSTRVGEPIGTGVVQVGTWYTGYITIFGRGHHKIQIYSTHNVTSLMVRVVENIPK